MCAFFADLWYTNCGDDMTTINAVIHGFAGGRHEMQPLLDYFSEKGRNTHFVTLKGHDATRKELACSRRDEWVQEAYRELKILCDTYDRVNLIGFSMGGLVSAHIASRLPINHLVFINTPIYYWDFNNMCANLKQDFQQKSNRYLKMYAKNCVDKPISSLLQFVAFLNGSKKVFNQVACDTLIIQSRDDDTVKHKSARYIYDHLSGRKKLIYFARGGHQILNSESSLGVCEEIDSFLTSNELL